MTLQTAKTPAQTDAMHKEQAFSHLKRLLTTVSRLHWIATAMVVAAGLAATWMASAADSKPAADSKADKSEHIFRFQVAPLGRGKGDADSFVV